MIYEKMTAADVDRIARLYMDYYNQHEDGCWTHEKACRRIRQIVTVEDSLCLIQQDDAENTTGFAIGYLKPYDDLTSYWLEEIVILAGYQNKGFGRQFLREIEQHARAHGAKLIELASVNDEPHTHFYTTSGMYPAFLKPSAFNSCYDTEDIPAILAIPDTLFFQPAFPFSDYCLKRGKAQFVEYQPEES